MKRISRYLYSKRSQTEVPPYYVPYYVMTSKARFMAVRGISCSPAWLGAILTAVIVATPPVWAAQPDHADLLPAETLAVLSVADVPELSQRFMNTAMGRMGRDPQLKPLVGHLYGSAAKAVAELKDQLGLALDEMLALPQDQLTVALVATEEGPPAMVALMDVGNQLVNARKLVERGTKALDQSGATRTEKTVAGTKFVIYDGVGPRKRQAVFFDKDTTLVVGTNLEVLAKILAAWNGEKSSTLSDNHQYTTVLSHCRGIKGQEPQLLWFVDPVALMRSIGQRSTQVRIAVAILPAIGLDGLLGVGGSLTMDAGKFDSISQTHILLDSPRDGVLDIVSLGSGDTKPEPWVPAEAASYTTLYWNIDKSYQSLTKLFDSFREEGAFDKMVRQWSMKSLGIDLYSEMLPALEGRLTYVTWIERPITPTSQAGLLALRLKDTKLAEKTLDVIFKHHEARLERKTYAGKPYYQLKSRQRPQPADKDAAENGRPEMPRPCFGIVDNYLMMSRLEGLYQKAITTAASPSDSLSEELDFKLIASRIKRQSGSSRPAMISFNRPEEGMRFLYGLATAERTRRALGKRAEKNKFFKSLDSALKDNPLPPFAVLQRYLAPGGALVVEDETGIHYTAFSLRRKLD